jgi:prophage DNA circulation protein
MTASRTPSWKLQLQKASFRGVNFHVGDIETVIGRRNVLHEYPLRDTPYAEDLGKKAREFTINAYVIGDDVYTQSKQLIAAIEDNDSPGVLVHPTLGIKTVIPQQCRHVFRNSEGGIEYFVLVFVEAGSNIYPSSVVDTQSNSQKVVAASLTSARASFSSMFNTESYNDALSKLAQDTLIGSSSSDGGRVIPQSASFTGVIQSILNKGAYFSGATQQFSALKSTITEFHADIETNVADPETLAEKITDIIEALANSYPDNPQQQLIALMNLFNSFGDDIPQVLLTTLGLPVTTASRIQMALNQQQLIDLIQIAALLQMVIAIAQIDFASREDAINTQATIDTLMEPKLLELADNANDEAYNALNDARTAMVLDIKTRAATLRTVTYVVVNYSIPALVLAYKQYQDATQDADIIARNNIKNPVFVPPNRNIEILV